MPRREIEAPVAEPGDVADLQAAIWGAILTGSLDGETPHVLPYSLLPEVTAMRLPDTHAISRASGLIAMLAPEFTPENGTLEIIAVARSGRPANRHPSEEMRPGYHIELGVPDLTVCWWRNQATMPLPKAEILQVAEFVRALPLIRQ